MADCIFCDIVSGQLQAAVVFEDDLSLAFLDRNPLFPGHVLLVPRDHYATLMDVPDDLAGALFVNAKLLAQAVELGLQADGVFVANNNRISQSVHHLHLHIVPRRKGDGLKGFFWPRHRYASDEEMQETALRIATAVEAILDNPPSE